MPTKEILVEILKSLFADHCLSRCIISSYRQIKELFSLPTSKVLKFFGETLQVDLYFHPVTTNPNCTGHIVNALKDLPDLFLTNNAYL